MRCENVTAQPSLPHEIHNAATFTTSLFSLCTCNSWNLTQARWHVYIKHQLTRAPRHVQRCNRSFLRNNLYKLSIHPAVNGHRRKHLIALASTCQIQNMNPVCAGNLSKNCYWTLQEILVCFASFTKIETSRIATVFFARRLVQSSTHNIALIYIPHTCRHYLLWTSKFWES